MLPRGNLRQSLQTRLLHGMIRKVGEGASTWKVLVVDRESLRILSAAVHVNELVNEGISIVEMLDMKREPLPRIPALYFLSPSAESIEQLAAESPSQYKEFHLYFTSRLPDFQMEILRANGSFLKKVRALVELDVQFLALETRVFSLGRPAASIPQMYADGEDSKLEMSILSERLTEACQIVAPGLDWTVRSEATSTSAKTVGALVKEQLDAAKIQRMSKAGNSDDATSGNRKDGEQEINKATLLVVDRAGDFVSPLVHEFSYQAMVHDLLKLNYGKPGGAHVEMPDEKDENKKTSEQLDDEEKDPIWSEIRSLFIEEALQRAQTEFKLFLDNDAAFKIRGKETGQVDIKDMSAAVRSLPDSQKRADKFAMHIKAARACLEVCGRDSLQSLSLIEQDLVTGISADSTKIRPEQMIDELRDIIENESIPLEHRARLYMLALSIAVGPPGMGGDTSTLAYSASFRGRLLRSGLEQCFEEDPALVAAINGLRQTLEIVHVGFENVDSRRKSAFDVEEKDTVAGKLRQKYAHRNAKKQYMKENAARRKRHGLEGDGAMTYDVARYHPPLRSLMMDLVDDELDKEEFPTTGTVSVDSIIASLGNSSVSNRAHSERGASKDKYMLRHGVENIRAHSASVAGMMKSLGKADSGKSPPDDDGRFRLAESDHLYMIFVVGGICYSEVRAMHEVCAKREANIMMGGSHILTPSRALEALGAVADPVTRIRAMLPPLPIELALSRAARAKALEAGRAKKAAAAAAAAKSAEKAGGLSNSHGGTGDGHGENHGNVEVEVVTGYKKSRAKRLFGRRKK